MAMKKLVAAAAPLALLPMMVQGATVEQLERQVQSLNQRLSAQEQRFRVNGFATFGIVQSDVEETGDTYHRGINNETNFRRYTKAGVQMTFNMDAQTSVVTQFVARGENDFDVKAEWAYFKHQINNQLTFKLGRLRKPNYLLSEYFDVGYAMPWTSAPVEVYGVLESSANYEAADLSYEVEMGDWTGTAQFQYGRFESNETVSDDLVAFAWIMTDGVFTFRAGYSEANASIVSGSETDGLLNTANPLLGGASVNGLLGDEAITGASKGQFAGLAFMMDTGSILAIAEYTSLTVDTAFPDQDSYYVMGGYRISQWMPYLGLSHVETTDDDTRESDNATVNAALAASAQALFNKEQDRTTVGVRYDYKPGVALKLQYDMVDVGDTKGEFDAMPTEDSGNIISFTIDTVF